jgi:hypothetical protein
VPRSRQMADCSRACQATHTVERGCVLAEQAQQTEPDQRTLDGILDGIRKRPDGRFELQVDGRTVRGTAGRSRAETLGKVVLSRQSVPR